MEEKERKKKILEDKHKTEEKIKTLQGKLKILNQELDAIEMKEKLKSTDEIVGLLQGKGVTDISEFINLIKAGKVNIDNK